MEKLNNKARAGEKRNVFGKRPGLSMEFKSNTLAASFTKSNCGVEVDYDYELDVDTADSVASTDMPSAVNAGGGKEGSVSVTEVDGDRDMDCLKNAAKASAKVAEVSSKTNWMKDKVSTLWSRKGKQEERPENPGGLGKAETGEKSAESYSMSANADEVNASDEKIVVQETSNSPIKGKKDVLEELSVEIKDGGKDKRQARATTGWIRDQVSSLITKGKSYASSGASVSEQNLDNAGDKLTKKSDTRDDDGDKSSSLSQSISDHYNLKQKIEGTDNVELNTRGTVAVNFSNTERMPKEVHSTEKEKFSDIHESITRNIAKQTTAAIPKDDKKPLKSDNRPSSPQVSNLSEAKKSSTKSKIKGFLSSKPLTTDLTHIPLSSSSKSDKGRNGAIASAQTQTKVKFNFAGKLSFSELLQSQEHGAVSNENEMPINGSLSSSPVLSRFQEPISEDEEEDDIIKVAENSESNLSPKSHSSTTFFRLWNLSIIFYATIIIPTNSFISGLIIGAFLMYLSGCLFIWLFCPSGKSFEQYRQEINKYLKEEEVFSSASKPNRTVDPEVLRKPRDLKGWVHFIVDYDARVFTLDITKDVFAVLKQETLHILFCKQQADNKPMTTQKLRKVRRGLRGRRNKKTETIDNQQPAFIFEKHHKISLSKCQLSLQPLDLPMRRIWNRKYPIRIDIPQGAMLVRDIDIPFEEITSNFDEYVDSLDGQWALNSSDEQFHILPNTAREKEDWFYRLQLCNKPLKHQIGLEDMRRGNLSNRPADSYPHYMVECIREGEKITSRVINGKRLEPHTAWLNVLLGRAFWDVWHEPYWKRKVWVKIQSRLNKLNTPPIIKEIYVKDLHLGHTLPVIHKGSLPELDEYGVWTDLQVTYEGEFTLTLETQLNVDYYVALLTKIAKQQMQTQDVPSTDVRMKVNKEKSGIDVADSSLASEGDSADFESDAVLTDQLPEIFLEAINQVEVDEEDLGVGLDDDPMISDPRTKAFLESKTGKRVAGVVGWLARSKIAKKVAETDFAKKAYEKAYEKFRRMPIILKVTVQRLKGTLAVNIAPPPSNRVWFGFRGTPAVLLTAHPKLGDRHVRLTYLTDWIERKLKEEFKKLFVLPSMQDLSVKLMNSRLEELYPDRPLS